MNALKLAMGVWLGTSLVAMATTEEQIHKQFTVQPGGKLIVEVGFGAIDVRTNATGEVTVDVWRKIGRKSKAAEEAFLRDNPVEFSQDGSTITIRSRSKSKQTWSGGWNRNEAKYTITVPARFDAQVQTAGGSIEVRDLTGDVNAHTSGGGLRFERLRGPLDGGTSGGSIFAQNCEGKLKINTSGGSIDVLGGSGSVTGDTSGGSVSVKKFSGPIKVQTSGGGITLENVVGAVDGSTSGGSIRASLSGPVSDPVRLSTSGGSVAVRLPADAAFDLDAETSAGSVTSDLPVTVMGKTERSRLKGTVNGGGKPMVLRTSAGSIQIRKL